MGKTKFQPSLVNEFPWVALLKEDTSKVYCTICKNAFRIDGSGKPQVFSHHKSHSIKDDGKNTKRKPAIDPSQQVFQPTLDGKIGMSEKTSLPPNHADYVCSAEIYQDLHVAQWNYSFASTQGDSRFSIMFPNRPIALVYAQADTKIRYNLQFGIAPYDKKQLIYDDKRLYLQVEWEHR